MKHIALTLSVTALLLFVMSASAGPPDPMEDCIRLFNAGSYRPAAECISRAAASQTDDPVLRMVAGVALANVRDYAGASKQFAEAARLAPGDPLPSFLLEGALLAQGKKLDAAKAKSQAGARLTGSARAGFDANQASNAAPVASAQNRTQLLGPNPRASALEREVARHPNNSIAHTLLGDLYHIEGRYTEAIAHYTLATELAPAWTKPWFNLGMAQMKVSPSAAIGCFRKVTELDPKNVQAQIWLGDAFVSKGDLQSALRAYNNAAANTQFEAQARSRMGNVYQKQNDLGQAEEQFDRATQLAPRDPVAAAGRAQVYEQTSRTEKSELEYERAMKNANPTQQSYIAPKLSRMNIATGEYDKAIGDLKDAVAKNPAYREPIRMLAEAYLRAGTLEQGITEYEALLKDPHNAVAMRFLLEAYRISGENEKRAQMAERLVKELPEQAPEWYCEFGLAKVAVGDRSAALAAWQSGLDAQPEIDPGGILPAAQAAGLLNDLRSQYEKDTAGKTGPGKLLTLAGIYEFTGDYANAAKVTRRLTEAYPGAQRFWIYLGDDLARSGDLEGAKQAYTKAALMPEGLTLQAVASQRLKALK